MKRILNGLIVATMAASLFGAGIASAQEKPISIDVAPILSIPTGDLADFAGIGFGAEAIGNYEVMPKLIATGAIGYIYHLEGDLGSASAIPIMAGAKYFVAPNIFVGGEIGFHMWTTEVDLGGQFGTVEGDETEVTLTPQVGYVMDKLTITGQYAISGDFSYLAARVSYTVW